ncbi:MAG: error-prone DNA polymerase [Chloroflexi bacterium]|nr:error-prone DNA polymerase [Chloroflexota bacterium]
MTSNSSPTYVELHCHTNFSLLDGASSAESLLERAKALGMDALAITDHNGFYGIVRFWKAALDLNIKPVFGVEMDTDEGFHLLLLARNMEGYANLCRLISRSHLKNSKGKASLDFATLSECAPGLFCLSGCRKGEIAANLLAGRREDALRATEKYYRLFGDYFRIELQNHFLPDDAWLCDELADIASRAGVNCVATNNVHYATPDKRQLQDVLVCIKHQVKLDESSHLRYANSEYYLKPAAEMGSIFARHPEAVANTVDIARDCNVYLDLSRYSLPGFDVPEGETPYSYLCKLSWLGAEKKYKEITPAVRKQLDHELGVIDRTGLAEYFLIVWDIMRFAKNRGIPAQGRGSAANSIVAYVLDITKVDPIRHNLLFERFLNEERVGMPDIDVDFSTTHREEVIQYVYSKYGQEYTAMVCTIITFRARSAVRDVGKALGFPLEVLDRMAKSLFTRSAGKIDEEIAKMEDRMFAMEGSGETVSNVQSLPWRQLFDLCAQIHRFPRHLGIHVGGMLITASPLIEVAPIENATAPGRVVVQFDKDDVEDLGLIKIDLLGLRTLSVVHDTLSLVKENRGITLDLDNLALDDPAVFDVLCEADTIGVFQVESRAQGQTLPKMRPRKFEDIIVEIAIIRPGPLQGNMVHPYLRRRRGLEKVEYLHPKLEPALGETMGVILFQEQVIRVAMAVAGFTPGEADMFRRAMGHHRSATEMQKIKSLFLSRSVENGVEEGIALQIFDQLASFAAFGFCKSHAAAFAKTAYDTAYLKVYFTPEFYAAILNNQPMGFYPVEVVVNDAKRHGVEILPVDANRSRAQCSIEGQKVRLGFSYVDGIGEAALQELERERENGPYLSLDDFYRRITVSRDALENLIMVGAFDSFGKSRRALLWRLGELQSFGGRSALPFDCVYNGITLPELSATECISAEYSIIGFSPAHQLLDIYEESLQGKGIVRSIDLERMLDGAEVCVVGFAVCRQAPPTAKGHVFLTLEDQYDLINVIVRPDVYGRYRYLVRMEPVLIVRGRLQRDGKVTSILARQFQSPIPQKALPEPYANKSMVELSHQWR